MREGISPDGRHYFPAFPYSSYARMPVEDLLDLRAYLMSLPARGLPSRPADVPLVWFARRAIGLWKRRALDGRPFEADEDESELWNRGAYLVQGPGHCGECHTPRDAFMVLDSRRELAGGKHPRGEGERPEPARSWSAANATRTPRSGPRAALRRDLRYDKLSSGGKMSRRADDGAPAEAGGPGRFAEYLVSPSREELRRVRLVRSRCAVGALVVAGATASPRPGAVPATRLPHAGPHGAHRRDGGRHGGPHRVGVLRARASHPQVGFLRPSG